MRAWPLDAGAPPAELFDGAELSVDEAAALRGAAAGLRYAELPAYLSDRDAVRSLEKALKERLAGKLAATVWTDPVTKATSQPGEDREAFAARLGQTAAAAPVARLRERLEKKKRDLAAQEQDLEGRKSEKWVALGSAVLSNIGLFTGRKRTISGAGTVALQEPHGEHGRGAGRGAEGGDRRPRAGAGRPRHGRPGTARVHAPRADAHAR